MCNPTENNQNKGAEAQENPFKMVSVLLSVTTLALLISTVVLATQKGDSPAPAPAPASTVTSTAVDHGAHHVGDMEIKSAPAGANPCKDKKKIFDFPNVQCVIDGIEQTGEQAGGNVTKGYNGNFVTDVVPITTPYYQAGLCPVNVHWHLGTEHYSGGQYDENGKGPYDVNERRKLAGEERLGYQCSYYDENDEKFTKPYEWKHCVGMDVGQTYEVHWPHSAVGACNTPNQYQSPFYDGVFCLLDMPTFESLGRQDIASAVGVQAQVFTIVNDEDYYWPDLMKGMIVDGEMGADMAIYTGSTTGTSRDNEICSQYNPITWQVDRKCHMVSASTFDKMCADMKAQRDDMSDDLYAHGSRTLVADHLTANNHQNLRA